MNGYELHRQYFDWAFENPEKNSPSHTGLMSWLIELNNRLGWKEKFGLPTMHTMEVLNIRSYKTYKAILDDLIEWGFVKMHQRAKNNHTANVIELVIFTKSDTNSLTKSITKSFPAQFQLNTTIDKPLNHEPINQETINISFDDFWNLFDYKKGRKKTEPLWEKLSNDNRQAIIDYLPAYKLATPDKTFRQHPATFLNKETWQDEIVMPKNNKLHSAGFVAVNLDTDKTLND